MKYGSLILEKKEYVYLKKILNISGYSQDLETQKSLIKLNDEIKDAQIVDEEEMPKDVIRLNSKVTIVSEKGWQKTLQIVTPKEKDFKNDKISIITPMGAALFGYAQDDTVIWDFPNGQQKLSIISVLREEIYSGIDIAI